MNNTSCFGATYYMQKGLAGKLSNLIVKNHRKIGVTIGSKSYSVHNTKTVYDTAKLIQIKHTCSLQKHA